MTAEQRTDDWHNAFLPIGVRNGERWEPRGGGVLLFDRPFVWLVTARVVLDGLGQNSPSVWVPRRGGPGLLDLGETQRTFGLGWIHHPVGLAATILPLDPSFTVKAFAEQQCTHVRDLAALLPIATVGAIFGADLAAEPAPRIAAYDGIVSSASPRSGDILTTAPMLPRNAGAPLLATSPHTGVVTLAGVMLGNLLAADPDPRAMPVRFGRAICVDAALELVRGEAAKAERQRATTAADRLRRASPAPDNAETQP